MLTNFFTIFSKINNIRSMTNNIEINKKRSNPLLNLYLKKNIDNYIALSNQKSFEIYSKYNTNTFSKFSVLDSNKKPETNIKKYINPVYFFIGCYYIFLASFSENSLLIV